MWLGPCAGRGDGTRHIGVHPRLCPAAPVAGKADRARLGKARAQRGVGRAQEQHRGYAALGKLLENVGRSGEVVAVISVERCHPPNAATASRNSGEPSAASAKGTPATTASHA